MDTSPPEAWEERHKALARVLQGVSDGIRLEQAQDHGLS